MKSLVWLHQTLVAVEMMHLQRGRPVPSGVSAAPVRSAQRHPATIASPPPTPAPSPSKAATTSTKKSADLLRQAQEQAPQPIRTVADVAAVVAVQAPARAAAVVVVDLALHNAGVFDGKGCAPAQPFSISSRVVKEREESHLFVH